MRIRRAVESGPGRSPAERRAAGRSRRGQTVVEYLLMTLMLLFLFTGMYRMLQGQLKDKFREVGFAILTAYY